VVLALLLCNIIAAHAADRVARLSDLIGLPVLSVAVNQVGRDAPDADLRTLVDIHPGFLLSRADVRDAVKRIYATGRFSRVEAHGRRRLNSVELSFDVAVRRRVGEIEVDGLDAADPRPLKDALSVYRGTEVTTRTAAQLASTATDVLGRIGFPNAAIDVTPWSPKGTAFVQFEIDVDEGLPKRITEVVFGGDIGVSDLNLRQIITTDEGSIANRQTIDDDAKILLNEYRSRGFFFASVNPPQLIPVDAIGSQRVVFDIAAGPRCSVSVIGNSQVPRRWLEDLWTGPVMLGRGFDGASIARAIVHRYESFGYQDTRVSFRVSESPAGTTTLGKAGVPRQYFLFLVSEGEMLRLDRVEINSARNFGEDEIRQRLTRSLDVAVAKQEAVSRGRFAATGYVRRDRIDLSDDSDSSQSIPPPSKRYLPEVYEDIVAQLRRDYPSRGFLKARIDDPVLRRVGELVTNEQSSVKSTTENVVVLAVDEGPQTMLAALRFLGNAELTDGDLSSVVSASRAVEIGGPVSPAALESARLEIIRRYRDEGFLYAGVSWSLIAVTDLEQAGTSNTLQPSLGLAPLRSDVRQLAVPAEDSPPRTEFATGEFVIDEGERVTIDRVLVRGNHHTSSRVITGRMTLSRGNTYQLAEAIADRRRIAGLGVFSKVTLSLANADRRDEQKDLVVDVVESPRHRLSLRWGASTEDGPRMALGYTRLNLMGVGMRFDASAKVNRQVFFSLYGPSGSDLHHRYESYDGVSGQLLQATEREVRMGLRSPRFTGVATTPMLWLDLRNERDNRVSFSLDRFAASLGGELRLGDYVTLALVPQVSLTDLECRDDRLGIEAGTDGCGEDVRELTLRAIDEGRRFDFKIGPRLTIDWRDSPFDPTNGGVVSASTDYVSGSLLGRGQSGSLAHSFLKTETRFSAYRRVDGPVLALSLRFGGIWQFARDTAPLDERFFLGGRSSLRGFSQESLTADDCASLRMPGEPGPVCGDRDGGHYYGLLKAEARLPVSASLSVDVFADLGNLWFQMPNPSDLRMRLGIGAGLSYNTPVGPLTIAAGLNPLPRSENAESRLVYHFSVGRF